MRIGIIRQQETLWSLQFLTETIISALRNSSFEVIVPNGLPPSADEINELYRKSDVVLHIASKSIWYERDLSVPTIFLCHAWMDHGAGIVFHAKSHLFGPYDILTFASQRALMKFRHVYECDLQACVLPFFLNQSQSLVQIQTNEIREKVRKKYRLGNGNIIVTHGRITPEKNTRYILNLAQKITHPCTFVIAGESNDMNTYGFGNPESNKGSLYFEKLRVFIQENHLQNKVRYVGKLERNDMQELLGVSDACVLLSGCFEEDFGYSLLEALRAGVPTICTDWGGYADIVDHQITGYKVPIELSQDFSTLPDWNLAAHYLSKLLDSSDLRDSFMYASRKRFAQYFSEVVFLENLRRILETSRLRSSIEVEKHIRAKRKYISIYNRALNEKLVHAIYLNNPSLFFELYGIYCGIKSS